MLEADLTDTEVVFIREWEEAVTIAESKLWSNFFLGLKFRKMNHK